MKNPWPHGMAVIDTCAAEALRPFPLKSTSGGDRHVALLTGVDLGVAVLSTRTSSELETLVLIAGPGQVKPQLPSSWSETLVQLQDLRAADLCASSTLLFEMTLPDTP
eukprot:6205400-Amphidinium_carterae.1